MELIKFLPSYVGSKAYWVEKLIAYKNEDFVEVFQGRQYYLPTLRKLPC